MENIIGLFLYLVFQCIPIILLVLLPIKCIVNCLLHKKSHFINILISIAGILGILIYMRFIHNKDYSFMIGEYIANILASILCGVLLGFPLLEIVDKILKSSGKYILIISFVIMSIFFYPKTIMKYENKEADEKINVNYQIKTDCKCVGLDIDDMYGSWKCYGMPYSCKKSIINCVDNACFIPL